MRSRSIAFFCVAILACGSAAHADVVTEWNTAALNAIRAGRTAPPTASRALAILHAAIYDAVNGISRTHESYRVASAVPRSASEEAAASAAAHRVLVTLFPAATHAFDALHARILATIPERPQKRTGITWGTAVAEELLLWRSNDRSDAPPSPPTGEGPGLWQSTPPQGMAYLLPQWAFVEPFTMPTTWHFRPLGPPALDSLQYADDYNEVRAFGAAVGSVRSAEQEHIALFWADGAGTETPPGHWNTIAQDVARRAGNTVVQNARLFALLNLAMADAAIYAWDAKYFFNSWRPLTAIRNGDDDGNADTVGDPGWNSLLVNPPFPDYVSGHSAFSGAAAIVLATFYGTDQFAFETGSDILPAITRQFSSFSAAAAEAAASRLYGGIHFRFAIEDGLTGGAAIGEWTAANFLTAKGNRSRDSGSQH